MTRELEMQNASLDKKCQRLRDYIRKLTIKCEEWANYADAQSRMMDKVKENRRQSNGTETHASYSGGTGNARTPRAVQADSTGLADTSHWSAERRMLDRVANLAQEEDLDALASELRNFGLN